MMLIPSYGPKNHKCVKYDLGCHGFIDFLRTHCAVTGEVKLAFRSDSLRGRSNSKLHLPNRTPTYKQHICQNSGESVVRYGVPLGWNFDGFEISMCL